MYRNKELSPKERAKALLSIMTIDEKVDQMSLGDLDKLTEALEKGEDVPVHSGVFCQVDNVDKVNKINEWYIKNTRLGIPLLHYFESLHGFGNAHATHFPQCAGLGGSFDKELVYKMAQVIGRESKAMGTHQVFAPDIDIPRDPRWGRMQEAYGEDPYLVGEMGVQYVKGVQENGVAATAKHYIAYGLMEGGINLTPAHVGEREIREVMLPPFKKCIEADVWSVMPSYNEIDGIPVHESKKWLKDVLRDELGFEGTTISDWGAAWMLTAFQKTKDTKLQVGEAFLRAGVDIEGPSAYGYSDDFRTALKNGEIDIKAVDEIVLRILELKFKLGLFDTPINIENREIMHTEDAVKLSRELDEESILLLKNDGLLPLDETKIGKVAVIGNNAKGTFIGDYAWKNEHMVDFYDGIVNRLGEENVLYARGCNNISGTKEMLDEAIEVAKQADIIFLALGDNSAVGGGIGGGGFIKDEITCSEGYDTHDLNMTPVQKALFDEMAKLGKPILFVMYAGRPYTVKEQVDKANAFMFSFGAGEQSGNAFANLIFGDKTPSAKLSISFPQTVGHLPCYYNHKVSARGSFYKRPGTPTEPGQDYVLSSPKAWMPFGYGLSYTTLEYSNLTAENTANGVKVCVDVENKGNYEIKESVLLFVSAKSCPITPFIKQLKAFDKVLIKSGEKKTVEFLLGDDAFSYIDEDYKTAKNKGMHTITVDNLAVNINVE